MPNRRMRPATIIEQAVRAWPATLAFALTLLLCTWAVGVPRYGAPDEVSHTTKAYGTAHRQTIGSPVPDDGKVVRYFTVPAGLVSGDAACFAFHSDINASCAATSNDSTLVAYGTTAGTYPPEWYAVVGGIARLSGSDRSVIAYRMISTLIGAALLVVALSLMRRAGGRNAALALIALNPMTIAIVASTNPSSTELAGTLLLWAYIAVLLTGERAPSRRQLLAASTIAAVIVLVRPVALPWVLVALGSLLLLQRRGLAADRRSTIRLLGLCSLPLVVAVVASSAWSRYAGVGLTDDRFLVSESMTTMLRTSFGRTADLFHQAFGILGWLDAQLPTPTYGLWIVCLVLVGTLIAFSMERRAQFILASIGVIWVVYPALFAALAKTPNVWQGRYNLPLLGGVVLCGLMATRATPWRSQADSIATFCAASWVIIEVLAFYQTLRRFMVGAAGSVLLRGGWTPPINAWVLIVVNAAMAVTVAWLMTRPTAVAGSS